MSAVEDYIKYIIKNHETLIRSPPIHIYIKRINNGLVFKMKDGYNLKLQTPETIKLLGSTKILADKKKIEKTYQALK